MRSILQSRLHRQDSAFDHHVMGFAWLAPDKACYHLEQAILPKSSLTKRERFLWIAKHPRYKEKMEHFVSALQKTAGVKDVQAEVSGRRVVLHLDQASDSWDGDYDLHQSVVTAYLDIYTNGSLMLQLGAGYGIHYGHRTIVRT